MKHQDALDLFHKVIGRDDIEPSKNKDDLLELLERPPHAVAQAAA